MAPSRGSLNNAAVRPILQIEDPPPSTLAAQIVDSLTKRKEHSKYQDQESFRQLLREILDVDDGHPDSIETNVEVNHKIIYVVVRSGIEVLFQDDPFNKNDDLTQQCLSSLAVIRVTIQRSPEVLFFTHEIHEPDPKLVGPLYLWLIPKLLSLLTWSGDFRIQEAALRVLQTILETERKTHCKGIMPQSVLKYIQGCVKDLLYFAEASSSIFPNNNGFNQAVVPTLATISEVCPATPGKGDLKHSSQVSIKSTSQAFTILLRLLSVFCSPSANRLKGDKIEHVIVPDYAWMLSSFTRIWNMIASDETYSVSSDVSSDSVSIFLDTVRNASSVLAAIKYESGTASRTFILLAHATASILQMKQARPSALLNKSICLGLLELASLSERALPGSNTFREHILPTLLEIRDADNRFGSFNKDVQQAILLAIRFCCEDRNRGFSLKSLEQEFSFSQVDLQQACIKHFYAAGLIYEINDNNRPQKRARLSLPEKAQPNADILLDLMSQLMNLLGCEDSTNLTDLRGTVMEHYSSLSENDQCLFYSIAGQLACAGARTLLPCPGSSRQILRKQCSVCDTQSRTVCRRPRWEAADSEALLSTMANVLQLPQMQKRRRTRVAAMLALKQILSHCGNVNHLDLATSVFGQWCLQALRSSLRDLRIAAGRTLPVFLQDSIDGTILRNNRVVALDFLRTLSEKSELVLQETCIQAWGQIARVSTGDETNIVLLRLVEYLGHTHSLVCGLAYDEIQRISIYSLSTPMRLFTPYWRTIAVLVVQDLQRRPQVAQQMSDLLEMTVTDFLRVTQYYTTPVLVLTKKRDILQRVAGACGRSIKDQCMDHNNLAAILAYILLQPLKDTEQMIMGLLQAASAEFDQVDCAELVKGEPMLTASELLKAAGENDDVKRSRAYQALNWVASITHGKAAPARNTARKSEVLGPFFETHVLGIMAHLSDTINDGKGPQSIAEKKRCLGAIREMIKLARSHISNGLPQICACLRSAVENKELSNEAFTAWIIMMGTLGEDEIGTLVDPTFAIVAQHWNDFDSGTQTLAQEMISQLLKSHASMIRDIVNTIPSLAGIPLMSKFEEELSRFRAQMDLKHQYQAFSQRCRNENVTVVARALIELETFLEKYQDFLHEAAVSEQPDPVVAQLTRSILDACVLFSESHTDISSLCARCLGLIGCLDPTRIEAVKEKREMLVVSNFGDEYETIDFIVFFLQEVLVKAFLSASSPKAQGFLAYAMQKLLGFCGFTASVTLRPREVHMSGNYARWVALPESVRNTLTPFLTSKYVVTPGVAQAMCVYPLYTSKMSHGQWLRGFVYDLLKNGVGENPQMIFPVFALLIRTQDISISNFLFPFAALNVIVEGTERQKLQVGTELLTVLRHPLPEDNTATRENTILCSQNVFQVLDYLARWMHEKKKSMGVTRMRLGRLPAEVEETTDNAQVESVERILSMIPAEVISRRAVECKSYARALFHWEQYIRQQKLHATSGGCDSLEPLYERLQDIYTQIDEPDGIEGISAHLQVLNIDQQIFEHRKAGRWTAAQSWYELQLTERPHDADVQLNLLTSLKESGQYDVLLNQIEGFQPSQASNQLSLPFAVEASWVTGKWAKLKKYLTEPRLTPGGDFNVGVGTALLALSQDETDHFCDILDRLRQNIAKSLSATNAVSLQSCHDAMLQFHVLTEIEVISGIRNKGDMERSSLVKSLNQRLDVLGAFLSDKQYILGLRRATMQVSKRNFEKIDVASAWLISARLARKGGFTHQAFNAVLHASQLGDDSATIEHSRLLWSEGHHRKAIQSLKGAIAANAFRSYDYTQADQSMTAHNQGRQQQQQNLLKARAHLLLAKWIDRAGQTQSEVIIGQYKQAVDSHNRWEKGHYYLGKHYNKLLESEKAKAPGKQAQTFITGETAKLVIENYLRSLAFGAKYIYQTVPRILTLWLELGTAVELPLDPKYGTDENFRNHTAAQRRKLLGAVHTQLKKYVDRLPPFVFYTALSQIVARVCHTNRAVNDLLIDIVARVVTHHPKHALWTLLAVVKSASRDRASKGLTCMSKVLEYSKTKLRSETDISELRALVQRGQKLSDQLLRVCEADIPGKTSTVSISRDLGFNHGFPPCKLVIPLESTLTASLPTVTDNVNMKTHKALSKEPLTISSFLDEVLVLNSLQRPRRISVRGSDGHVYALLCKPKDDLRKDQRLMEFNAMINRSLKKDADSSKRRLYIKTYAVTPLNEECGLIEWVDNLKTLRDILLSIYRQKNIQPNYGELRNLLNEATSSQEKLPIFQSKVLAQFPPVFHEWFVEMFPEPAAWFTARLRYTRSCAVMSIVGHVLGLGDRHGENILFEEGNGGTFHVDFNCLFDKGLTFEKPELVPFRLTHNMVDAFGAYGYDGPFRKSAELTLQILRQNEDTLMTILETFVYDPTTDFIGKKKRKENPIVPDTPEGVLEQVRNKVRGFLGEESVPLSVEGYVQELVVLATDEFRLASMYIGWCAFF